MKDKQTPETGGVIYIMTNPSFPEYVKIGYSDNVQTRLQQLNKSEAVPYAFRVYATYKVKQCLSDKTLHSLIDNLNPDLRTREEFNGKKRVREFYIMSAEQAYKLLHSIASISGTVKKQPLLHRNLHYPQLLRITLETGLTEPSEYKIGLKWNTTFITTPFTPPPIPPMTETALFNRSIEGSTMIST